MKPLKWIVLLFVLILIGGCASTKPQKSGVQDGEFIGEETGWPEMKVKVRLHESQIQAIEILEAGGTPSYTDQAIAVMPDRVIQANSTEVDSVTGATLSCESFLSAVRDALGKAK
ncbi:FMN-binding protein [candidate division KSB1 bacterium]|nr:FMN-binding protein [candidate division KSB1 bacterium]